jgi:hypothetical protein
VYEKSTRRNNDASMTVARQNALAGSLVLHNAANLRAKGTYCPALYV